MKVRNLEQRVEIAIHLIRVVQHSGDLTLAFNRWWCCNVECVALAQRTKTLVHET